MTSCERVLRSLNHEEADRVPIDIGSAVTSIHKDAYRRLKTHLGLGDSAPEIIDNMQQVVKVEEPLLELFSVDTRQLFLHPAKGWQKLPDGSFRDEWGIKWKTSSEGRYYDMYEHPLADAMVKDLERFDWPDPDDPRRYEGLKEEAKELFEKNNCAIVLNGFGEPIFGIPSWMRGQTRFYMDFIENTDFLNAFLDIMLEYAIRLAENTLAAVGRYIHVIRIADDLGSEKDLIISPSHYRQFIKPRQKKLISFIKEHSACKILLHSCGSVYPIIDDFIEIGVDALNPIQVSARDMDTKRLKKEFGDRITFWGGGCDTQRVLPFGTGKEIVEEVKRRIRDLAPGGGFVFTPVHNIQYDVSAERIISLYETALKFGQYPIAG
jgi:uroporphyrinogen decarboxylase